MPRPLTLGVLAPFCGGEYLSHLIAELCCNARARGVRVICIRTGDFNTFDLPVAVAHVDAWVVVQNSISRSYLAHLQSLGIPIVSIAHNFDDPQIVSVESDNEGSTPQLLRYNGNQFSSYHAFDSQFFKLQGIRLFWHLLHCFPFQVTFILRCLWKTTFQGNLRHHVPCRHQARFKGGNDDGHREVEPVFPNIAKLNVSCKLRKVIPFPSLDTLLPQPRLQTK